MKKRPTDLGYATFRLVLARSCREANRVMFEMDYPKHFRVGRDEGEIDWLTECLLLRAPVTLPKVKGQYICTRNP